jgi:dimethylsulfoniopropionate demethylase
MLLPSRFRGLEEDYWHLRKSVQIWDVACERQVQLKGPDASKLAQMMTVRDIRTYNVGRGGLVPLCDHNGKLLNDPVVFRIAEDCYWFSISDSDVAFWAGGLAHGLGLDVEVSHLLCKGHKQKMLLPKFLAKQFAQSNSSVSKH